MFTLSRPPLASRPMTRPSRASTTLTRMKKDIHPDFHDDAKVFCNGEEVMTVSGCREKYVVDVWSGNHPFYTGALTANVNDESRIAQFQKKYGTGRFGAVAPVSAGGNTKLEYKVKKDKKKK